MDTTYLNTTDMVMHTIIELGNWNSFMVCKCKIWQLTNQVTEYTCKNTLFEAASMKYR